MAVSGTRAAPHRGTSHGESRRRIWVVTGLESATVAPTSTETQAVDRTTVLTVAA